MLRRVSPVLLVLLAAAGCGGGGGKPTGPPAPVFDTIRTFRGKIAYFVTGPKTDARDEHGRLIPDPGFVEPNLPRGAPRVFVEVLSTTGALFGATTTDSLGNYQVTVNFGKIAAPPARIRASARATISGGTDLRVLADILSPEPYSVISPPTTDPNLLTTVIDLSVALDQGAAAF